MSLLRQGSRGPAVTEIQTQLNEAGGSRRPPLVADGIFGSNTRLRVAEFQQAKGLGADGIVGPATRAALGGGAHANGGTAGAGAGAGGAAGTIGGGLPQGANSERASSIVSRVVGAAKSAHGSWRSSAVFNGVVVCAVNAVGVRGCVAGPPLGPTIAGAAMSLPPADRDIGLAAASGISSSFASLQSSISVPGLPWYPSFANYPAPVAPPTPNVPTPLMMLVGRPGAVGAGSLADAMDSAYQGSDPAASAIFGAIASQLAPYFIGWIGSTSIRNVLGTGTVPMYAPPVILSGPVLHGSVISAGGHF